MTNNFAEEYRTYKEIENEFDTAERAGDKAGVEKAQEGYQELQNKIQSKGEGYARAYRLYEEAMERGNENIDIRTNLTREQTKNLLKALRENGIRQITYSCDMSGSQETAWTLTQNGGSLTGMKEINGAYRDFQSGEFEKVHAYIFNI